jgi:hypothetical protein
MNHSMLPPRRNAGPSMVAEKNPATVPRSRVLKSSGIPDMQLVMPALWESPRSEQHDGLRVCGENYVLYQGTTLQLAGKMRIFEGYGLQAARNNRRINAASQTAENSALLEGHGFTGC